MSFRLDNYMERWACLYKGIRHTKKDPRFFRCSDELNLDEFLQNFQRIADPVCGIVTNWNGKVDIPKRLDKPVYTCMFLGRADANDYKRQADVKAQSKEIAKKFLIYLDKDRQAALRTDRTSPLALINLSDITYNTIGPLTSAWWFGTYFEINAVEYEKECFTESDYLPDSEAEWLIEK